jgi:hypothetical protein
MNLERANWTLKPGRDWHLPWYEECLRIIDTFTMQTDSWRENNVELFWKGTNLCHYVRVCTVWGGGILALQLLTVYLVWKALISLPIQVMGFSSFLIMLVGLAIFGVFAYGVIQLARWADQTRLGKRILAWIDKHVGIPLDKGLTRAKERLLFRDGEGVSFWSMLWEAIIVAKHFMCPLIEIARGPKR